MTDTPKIDISAENWGIVLAILQRHVPGREIWAFGSRARWTAKPFSDLDLAIMGDQALPLATLAALENDFSESDLPFKVDVVDWASTNAAFRRIIDQEHVVLLRDDTRA